MALIVPAAEMRFHTRFQVSGQKSNPKLVSRRPESDSYVTQLGIWGRGVSKRVLRTAPDEPPLLTSPSHAGHDLRHQYNTPIGAREAHAGIEAHASLVLAARDLD